MSDILVVELPKRDAQSSYNDPRSKREYAITGVPVGPTDHDIAINAMLAVAPAADIVAGQACFYDSSKVTEVGGGCWTGEVNYKYDQNQFEIIFDTAGAKTKKQQSIETITQYDCRIGGDVTPTFERAIGVNGPNVEGVEIEAAKFCFTVIMKLKMSVLSDVYLQTIYDLTSCVNDDDYTIEWKEQSITFEKETLKFDGMVAKQTSKDDLDISMKFSAKKSITVEQNFSIGASGPIAVTGWQYLWIQYDDIIDDTMHRPVRKPIYACVERVYEMADFTLLGL